MKLAEVGLFERWLFVFFNLALASQLTQCASKGPSVPPPPSADLSSNPYFQTFASTGPASTPLSPSAFRFLVTEARPLFRDHLVQREARSAWLTRYPQVITPNTLNPFSDEVPGDRLPLEWQASGAAPWWTDPLRLEVAALVLAEGQSLRDYRGGACWKGYAEGLTVLEWVPPALELKPVPSTAAELEAWEPWKSAARDVPAWQGAFSKAWAPDNPVVELRSLPQKPGEGARYLARMTNGALAEYREVSAESGEEAAKWKSPPPKDAKPFTNGCDRFLAVARSWRTESKCLTVAKKSFSLEVWKKTPPATLNEGRFESAAALTKQVGSLCRMVGAYHGRQLRFDQAQELRALLEKNPAFVGRLERTAAEESDQILQAYRALLARTPAK